MRKILIVFSIGFACLGVYGQEIDSKPVNTSNETVVINKKMIERFQNCEYDEDMMNLSSLMHSYSFDEVKTIMHEYKTSDLTLSKTKVDKFLKEESSHDELAGKISEESQVLSSLDETN